MARRVKIGKNKQKSSSKPKPQKTKMSKAPMKNMDALMKLSMGVCSLSNPFCPEAVGARWPDNSLTKSTYWGLYGMSAGNMITDANGAAARIIIPDFGITGATITGGIYPNMTFNTYTSVATFPSNVARYRITSAGFRVTAVVAPLSASGTLRIRLFSPVSGSTLNSVDVTTMNCDDMYDIPIARLAKNDIFVNFISMGETMARQYRTPPAAGAPLASWVNPGWQIASLAVDGAVASTSIVQVYLYYHYELVFDDSSATQMFATAPPSNSLVLQQGNAGVVERIGNFIEGTVDKVDKIFKSNAFKWAASATAYAFGGPSAGAATYNAIGGASGMRAIRDVD